MYELPSNAAGFDIIGDVHGCYVALQELLNLMGYRRQNFTMTHPQGRKLIFLGDLIDRGPQIRETILLIRELVESNIAYVILGNHEFNALTFCTKAPEGFYENKATSCDYLRSHTVRHTAQIEATMNQFANFSSDWNDTLRWFRELPLILESEEFRLVHACWDPQKIALLQQACPQNNLQDDDFLHQAADWRTPIGQVVDRILTGTEMRLPKGYSILGQDGVRRSRFRTMFWSHNPKTYADIVFQPDELPEAIAAIELTDSEKQNLLTYASSEKPVFIGHYWCQGAPKLIKHNIACLDFSAVNSGSLVAYRMHQEKKLRNPNFVWVETSQ